MPTMRSKPLASTFFKARGDLSTTFGAIPRYKFMFYANLIPSDAALSTSLSGLQYSRLGTYEDGVSFKIKTIDKPKIELNTTELNQYNRKRYAYTKIEYQPMTIRMYDTVDDKPLRLWMDYFTYYFADTRPKTSDTVHQYSITDGDFSNTYDTGFGLNPRANRYNFFQKIELYALFGGKYTQTNYINPKIISIDWSNHETDSSDMGEITMTFKYEAVEYKALDNQLSAEQLTQFGFRTEGVNTLEVSGIAKPTDSNKSWKPTAETPLKSTKYTLPTDVSQSATQQQLPVNLFNDVPVDALSMMPGTVLPQSVGVSAAIDLFGGVITGQLLTNPNAISGFLSGGLPSSAVLASPLGSALGGIGSFNFGSLQSSFSFGVGIGDGTGAQSADSATPTPNLGTDNAPSETTVDQDWDTPAGGISGNDWA